MDKIIDFKEITGEMLQKSRVTEVYYIDFYYDEKQRRLLIEKNNGKWVAVAIGVLDESGVNITSDTFLMEYKDEILEYFTTKSSIRIELIFI